MANETPDAWSHAQEDQEADLSNVDDSFSAFADDMQSLVKEGAQETSHLLV